MQKYANGLRKEAAYGINRKERKTVTGSRYPAVTRQAVLFEEEYSHGQVASAVKFEVLSEEWFEQYAKLNLKSTTLTRQRQLTNRVYKAIGHIRIDKLTARDIQKFISNLAGEGVNEHTGKPLSHAGRLRLSVHPV